MAYNMDLGNLTSNNDITRFVSKRDTTSTFIHSQLLLFGAIFKPNIFTPPLSRGYISRYSVDFQNILINVNVCPTTKEDGSSLFYESMSFPNYTIRYYVIGITSNEFSYSTYYKRLIQSIYII